MSRDRDDDGSFAEALIKGASKFVVLIAIAAASRCESTTNKARKPELVEDMVKRAEIVCAIKNVPKPETSYYDRLRGALTETFSNAMDAMNANGITVCPDMRLSQQKKGFWDKEVIGIYYPRDHVVSIYDDGSREADKYGNEVVEKLAEHFEKGTASTDKPMFAGRYGCGDGCTKTKLLKMEDFDDDTIAKNPQLMKPPTFTAFPYTGTLETAR